MVARKEREVYRETLKEAADEMSSHVRAMGPVPVLSCPELVHGRKDQKLYLRCDVDSLAQLAEVVDKSSKNNIPVLNRKTDGSENWAW
ncbi:hypothetical protein MAR_019910 [Mya arenaria]|uniref:Uncharacterized protein n=1 Tax=Mya arenaria TaxID=6604 RepID=A0ABY7EBL0_MYAAR|nr:hypothetical protein MAR_019910 [Mya arenaria]